MKAYGKIQIKAVLRKSPKNGRVNYYAAQEQYSNIGDAELRQAIQRNSNLSSGIVNAACEAIMDSVMNFVCNGHSIKIANLMCLRPVLKSRPAETAAKLTFTNIKKVILRASWAPALRVLQNPDTYNMEMDGHIYPAPVPEEEPTPQP